MNKNNPEGIDFHKLELEKLNMKSNVLSNEDMNENNLEGFDFNRRELEKLNMQRNALYNVILRIEVGENPIDDLRLQYKQCVEKINDLEQIIKEPLHVLDQHDLMKDLRALFIKSIKDAGIDEEQMKIIEEKMKYGAVLHEDDISRYFKYFNYLSFQIWKQDMEIDIKFWKEIVVENSKINNAPYEVADESLNALKKQFYNPENLRKIKLY
jgi:hypothetical protein